MPQLILPMIPEGATRISDLVTVYRSRDRWTCYMGLTPIYAHAADDRRLFRLITSMMIDAGTCRHKDIIETFGVSKSNVQPVIKKAARRRPGGFFFKENQGAVKVIS